MAMTRLQANWTAVTHGSTTITHVNSCQFQQGGALESYSADGDQYPTVILHLMSKPRASVVSGDIGLLQGFAVGTVGTFTATHKDAKLASGGDIIYTLINAAIENVDATGAHAQIGSATMSMLASSSDGITNPLSIARA